MRIFGKLLGGTLGFSLGGPVGAFIGVADRGSPDMNEMWWLGVIVGVLIGFVIGHVIDWIPQYLLRSKHQTIWKNLDDIGKNNSNSSDSFVEKLRMEKKANNKIEFAVSVIVLSAKMAKADGQVTIEEIRAFRKIFDISENETVSVAKVWNEARNETAGFEVYATYVSQRFGSKSLILENLIGILFYVAMADGILHVDEKSYLREVAKIFGFDEIEFENLLSIFGGGSAINPYEILGIKSSDSDAEVKSAYRKLIQENHPDRLVAQGLPEEFVKQANDKMAAINAAYDEIMRSRNIR